MVDLVVLILVSIGAGSMFVSLGIYASAYKKWLNDEP